ncbi:MAG: hypothetical protein ABI662_07475 [Dermatophilaceae bacterium]
MVMELVTTLRQADSLVHRMREEAAASPTPVDNLRPQQPPPRPGWTLLDGARSWFAGRSVGVILLVLGTVCVLAAGVVFIAVAWRDLPLGVRALILIVLTSAFGLFARIALMRGLQATAEAMAAIACGMLVLDLAAGRRAGLPGLADLSPARYEILAGSLLVVIAVGGALLVRSRSGWLWSLDAAVALGTARAALGILRMSGEGYAVPLVTVTVASCLLYVTWHRLRLPVAMWSTAFVGGAAWIGAVLVGTHDAADRVGTDILRLAQAWPALTAAVVAGLWSIGLGHAAWRRVFAGLSLVPVVMVFEVIGWSHGWVAGATLLLAGYVIAVLVSARVPLDWSPSVGGAALVLGLSSVYGLVPSVAALGARMELALAGGWREPERLPFALFSGDVAPWLLPLTALVLLGLLSRITIEGHSVSIDPYLTVGAVVATLGVLTILYGAGFWTSMAVLVFVALLLLWGARLWGHDMLLVLGLALLGIIRVFAYYNDLADPLAWTLMSFAALALAVSERREMFRVGFLTAAGLFALFGAALWLTLAGVPRPFQGLVIVVIGSLALVASQGLRSSAHTRWVAEGLSVIWAAAGLGMAEGSASHGALELTVIGVATGITAYLSEDRRRAGWVSGVLLTLASWIRLAGNNVQAVEWYTVPAAMALLFYGARRLRRDPRESTWRCLGPGMMLALTPSLLLTLDEPISWRGLFVAMASLTLVALGVQLRLAAPFAMGVAATGLLALRNIWPVAVFIPRWTLLFLVGGVLLGVGMTWESRVNDVRTADGFVRGLR